MFRFGEPQRAVEEEDLVYKAIPTSTKYKNKWAITIFNKQQTWQKVQVPVLDSGGTFQNNGLPKVGVLFMMAKLFFFVWEVASLVVNNFEIGTNFNTNSYFKIIIMDWNEWKLVYYFKIVLIKYNALLKKSLKCKCLTCHIKHCFDLRSEL